MKYLYLDEPGLKTAWDQPRVTWGGACLEELSQVKAEIKKIPDKCDVEQPPPPSPSSSQPQTSTSGTGTKPKCNPAFPKDIKETPNQWTSLLHLEGTRENNKKSLALSQYSQKELNKVLTEVN